MQQDLDQDLEWIRERRRMREAEDPFSPQEPQKKQEYWVRLVLLQAVIVLVLVGAVAALRKLSPQTFSQLQTQYLQLMQEDMAVRDVFAALKDAVTFMVTPVDADEGDPGNNAESDGGEPDDPLTQANAATTTQGETTTVGERKGESKAETTTAAGTGGVDIGVYEAAQNTCFAPFYVTGTAVTPVTGRLTSLFGYRNHPVTGAFSFHTGVDIAAAAGTPIAAMFSGVVKEVGQSDGWGNFVRLSHQNGLETFYAHCQTVYAQQGAVLRAGETLALVGSTGVSTGPHLHLEVRLNGVRMDPLWILNL